MGKTSEYYETDKFAQTMGMLSPLLSTPLHRIQVILQTQNEAIKQNLLKQRFEGIGEVYKHTMSDSKWLLWRGITSKYCIGVTNFYFHGKIYSKLLPKRKKYDTKVEVWAKMFGAGVVSSALAHLFTVPLEYHFTRVQYPLPYRAKPVVGEGVLARLLRAPPESLFTLIPFTVQSEGYRGVYRGYGASMLASVIYRGLYLSLLDFSLPYLPYHSILGISLFGFTLTTLCGGVVYPMDTVRRRMFVTQLGGGLKYANAREAFKEIVSKEGYLSLYRGFGMHSLSNFFAAYLVFGIVLSTRMQSQSQPPLG